MGSSPSRLGCFHAPAATVSSDAANSLQSAVDVVPVQKLGAERCWLVSNWVNTRVLLQRTVQHSCTHKDEGPRCLCGGPACAFPAVGTEPGQGLGLEQFWESLGEAEVPADRWGCGRLGGTVCDHLLTQVWFVSLVGGSWGI
ncbi:unnamed protein product [Rangifer tarandus platyrhynchus]|uniref:Uncharacterized protein n=1 Tax=Rangifer tarandus platyrhynchus TaxID=3082113 RepID=A0ACB1KHD8_RANTA